MARETDPGRPRGRRSRTMTPQLLSAIPMIFLILLCEYAKNFRLDGCYKGNGPLRVGVSAL